jgi:hypothetical protein
MPQSFFVVEHLQMIWRLVQTEPGPYSIQNPSPNVPIMAQVDNTGPGAITVNGTPLAAGGLTPIQVLPGNSIQIQLAAGAPYANGKVIVALKEPGSDVSSLDVKPGPDPPLREPLN